MEKDTIELTLYQAFHRGYLTLKEYQYRRFKKGQKENDFIRVPKKAPADEEEKWSKNETY